MTAIMRSGLEETRGCLDSVCAHVCTMCVCALTVYLLLLFQHGCEQKGCTPSHSRMLVHLGFCSKIPETFQAWWFTPVIIALKRLREEDQESESRLGYV